MSGWVEPAGAIVCPHCGTRDEAHLRHVDPKDGSNVIECGACGREFSYQCASCGQSDVYEEGDVCYECAARLDREQEGETT